MLGVETRAGSRAEQEEGVHPDASIHDHFSVEFGRTAVHHAHVHGCRRAKRKFDKQLQTLYSHRHQNEHQRIQIPKLNVLCFVTATVNDEYWHQQLDRDVTRAADPCFPASSSPGCWR
jgi:hypothetical protein